MPDFTDGMGFGTVGPTWGGIRWPMAKGPDARVDGGGRAGEPRPSESRTTLRAVADKDPGLVDLCEESSKLDEFHRRALKELSLKV